MRKAAALVSSLLVAGAARAQLVETTIQPAGGLNWSTTAGRTVGMGNTALQLEAGWPGVSFTYLHGVDERTDWGFRASFNYGLEGTNQAENGVNLALAFRRTLGWISDTAVAVEAAPGFSIYSNNGSKMVGIGGPIGLVCGFKLDPQLTFDVGATLPILISFSNPAGLYFGPQFGIGGEYLIDANVAITLRVRVGPEFALHSGSTNSSAGFTTLLGVAYNIR
jgi:hypothetical protein